MDNGFNMKQFYDTIVALFEDAGDWGTETLAWWNA
jgi:hypothetical protein